MGYIGGYDLHLYCDARENCDGFDDPDKFSGETKTAAKKNARSAGWTINESGNENESINGQGRTVCPMCARN